MRIKITGLLLFFAIAFINAAAFSAPVKPNFSGSGYLGNITSQMPNPTNRMAQQPHAYPTNRWWGSVYLQNAWHNYSLQMSLGPTVINFNTGVTAWYGAPGAGYIIGPQELTVPTVASTEVGINKGPSYIMWVLAVSSSGAYINAPNVKVANFSDWAVTATLQDQIIADNKMTITFAKGSPFTYNTFSTNVRPQLRFHTANNSLVVNISSGGKALLRVNRTGAKNIWYGVYAPEDTTFAFGGGNWWMDITFPASAINESGRYLSVAFLGAGISEADARILFDEYYKYAYNFVSDTKVSWKYNTDSSITTIFNWSFDAKRTGEEFIPNETVFYLFPHHWRYLAPDSQAILNTTAQELKGFRGKFKTYQGPSFKTKYEFHGVLPNLSYEFYEPSDSAAITKLKGYIDNEKGFNLNNPPVVNADDGANNTYRRGKVYAKAANMIPIFHQAKKFAERDEMITNLKTALEGWYSNTSGFGQSFAYDATWGGIIGIPYDFGTQLYNDHHFHHGYFVYASAILSMFDSEFTVKYKDFIGLLIKDFANFDRNDRAFPFLRNFDIYEGHSWSNGYGFTDAGDDGNDQESISEAMNAWAGIYLWGVMTDNQELMALGMYGYTTESKASEEYYFDVFDETYPVEFTHRGGILYDSVLKYRVHWEQFNPTAQEKYGIWVVPLTPSMLYLGYYPSNAQSFYTRMEAETTNNNPAVWKDVLLRYKSLFNATGALSDWNTWNPTKMAEAGSSLTFSYHFINFFNKMGTVSMDYYATDSLGNSVPFTVLKSTNGTNYNYIAYNNSINEEIRVTFYPRVGGGTAGTMVIPPKTMIVAYNNDFSQGNLGVFSFYDYMFSNRANDNSWSVLITGAHFDFNTPPDPAITISTTAAMPPVNASYEYIGNICFEVGNSGGSIVGSVPLNFKFSSSIVPAGVDISSLRLAYYNSSKNTLEVIDVAPDVNGNIYATLGNAAMGKYVLVKVLKSSKVYAYPSPYRPSKHGNTGITFTNVKVGAKIRVYNIVGEKVFDTTVDAVNANSNYVWDVRNNSNSKIASGMYLYYIEDSGKVTKGKFVIER